MPNVYGQNTKITDVVGRSRYISGESDKQEEVIVHEKNMMYDWSFYSAYERENAHQENQRQNEAREMIIALPNELADKNKVDLEKFHSVDDEITYESHKK